MFSSLFNAIQTPSKRPSFEPEIQPKSPLSQAIHGLESLHLTDDLSLPGTFPPGPTTTSLNKPRMPPDRDAQQSPALSPLIRGLESLHLETATTEVQIEGLVPSSPTLERLETLVTAATMTSSSMDTFDHGKLFSSSVEFYEHRGSTVPNTLQSLDMSTAMQGLTAAVSSRKPTSLPAFRAGRQFGRKQIPVYSPLSQRRKSRSPPPSPAVGKVAADEVKDLDRLDETLCKLQLEVLDESFDTLPEDTKCQKLDAASAFVKDGLIRIAHYEAKYKARVKMAGYRGSETRPENTKERRASIIQGLKMFHIQICALYAPLLAERPLVIDAEYAYHSDFTYLDQINQVLVLLAVICNMIIGLSTLQCDFLINVATMCVKLGMSTVGSGCSDPAHSFPPSQNAIISDMPTSLSAALKRFGADSRLELYATCPSCSCTHKSISLAGPNLYEFPVHCTNRIVGKHGISVCGKELLTRRQDGTLQPSKPYLVSSLPDYLARCLADETYLQQSVDATDEALHAIRTGEEQIGVQNVFEASFIKDLKGPDGKLFVEREDKVRLAFSMHTDFFNPHRITHRGPTQSLGIISCANLALDTSIRYLPEYLFFGGIIPGPHEPNYDEMDHFVRPVVEQFVQAWRPGLRVTRTAASESGATVEAGILLSVNDLPAARKVAGFAGTGSAHICSVCQLTGKAGIFNTNHAQWIHRDSGELRHWAAAYRDSQTLDERKDIFNKYGVRWSSLWLLEYWDPTRMLVIDSMHCILEGLVQYQCRHILRLDASKRQLSSQGINYAFDWQWTPYSPATAPDRIEVDPKHIPDVAKIQDTLCYAIEGDKSLSLDRMWTRLDRQVSGALEFVVWSLDLSPTLENISPVISSLYVERAKRKSKRKNRDNIQFPPVSKVASQKDHFIALLLNWRLTQPHNSSEFVVKTGAPETLLYILKVIKEAVTPSWLNSVPKDFGDAKAGTLKADEWRTLSTVYLPIALIILWGDADGSAPPEDDSDAGFLLKALDHTMALFQATILACRHSMTASRAFAYRQYHAEWVEGLKVLFPWTREGRIRPNIHAAGHIYDFLLLFGPVMSWWCFPFERLIGALQKINTNEHIGGEMEATIIKSVTRTANIRRWLRRPDCPEAVRQLKIMFDKCFVPANAVKPENGLRPMKGPRRAYARWDAANFSAAKTHPGNATIIYRPTPSEKPIAGQIQDIRNITTPSGFTVELHVRPFEHLPKSLYDPFSRYPHLSATSYSSTLREKKDIIRLEDIVAHAARFDYSYHRTVLVNLSRD